MNAIVLPLFAETVFGFDARGIARRFRHVAIFAALDALQAGEIMRFCNDHEPAPLLASLAERYGDRLQVSRVSDAPGEVLFDFRVVK